MKINGIHVVAWNFGHPVRYKYGRYKYIHTGEENSSDVYQNLDCPRCGLKPTKEGHDPCISNLKNVDYACCGHGRDLHETGIQQAYIKHSDGYVIRFDTTGEILEHIDKNKEYYEK